MCISPISLTNSIMAKHSNRTPPYSVLHFNSSTSDQLASSFFVMLLTVFHVVVVLLSRIDRAVAPATSSRITTYAVRQCRQFSCDVRVKTSVTNVRVKTSVTNVRVKTSVTNVRVKTSVTNVRVKTSVTNVRVKTSVTNVRRRNISMCFDVNCRLGETSENDLNKTCRLISAQALHGSLKYDQARIRLCHIAFKPWLRCTLKSATLRHSRPF